MASMTDKQKFYSDVIILAVEGGIGYWSHVRSYNHGCSSNLDDDTEVGRKPARAEVFDFEDGNVEAPDAKWHKLDNKAIAKAFKSIMGKGEIAFAGERWRKRMVAAYWANDANDLDSDDADMVVQIALLGKVVYG